MTELFINLVERKQTDDSLKETYRVPTVREKVREKIFFQGQGIVREFWNLLGNFGIQARVREKSGNFEIRKQVYER